MGQRGVSPSDGLDRLASLLSILHTSAKNKGIGIYRDSQAPCKFFTKHL